MSAPDPIRVFYDGREVGTLASFEWLHSGAVSVQWDVGAGPPPLDRQGVQVEIRERRTRAGATVWPPEIHLTPVQAEAVL